MSERIRADVRPHPKMQNATLMVWRRSSDQDEGALQIEPRAQIRHFEFGIVVIEASSVRTRC
jgi:hypothetical protein